jgi:hypothetical protein
VHSSSYQATGAAVIETPHPFVYGEEVRTRIPKGLGRGREKAPQLGAIHKVKVRVIAATKKQKEFGIWERSYSSKFKFEKCILSWVYIDCMNFTRSRKYVIKCVAACRCNDQNAR